METKRTVKQQTPTLNLVGNSWDTLEFPAIDKTKFKVLQSLEDPDEIEFWQSLPWQERLLHLELLRRLNYGSDATARLQRVLTIAERKRG